MELRAETQNLSLSLGCVIVNQKASGIEPEPDPAAVSPLVPLDRSTHGFGSHRHATLPVTTC